MARRNNKRRARKDTEGQAADMAASMAFCAVLNKIFGDVFDKEKPTEKNVVDVPTDGTAVEFPVQEGFEVFISEEGKPMVRRKMEDGDKQLIYEDVAKSLYKNKKDIYFWNASSEEADTFNEYGNDWGDLSNCMTIGQVKRLMAFNKLQNIAKYLNDGWKPDFQDKCSRKYHILFDICKGTFFSSYVTYFNEGNIYFKTEELAEEAIRIMGEESLKDLFSTDW